MQSYIQRYECQYIYIDIEPSRLCAYLSFHCLSLLHQLADTESVSFPSPAHRIPSTRVPPHARDAFCSVCTSTHAPRAAQQINDPCTAPTHTALQTRPNSLQTRYTTLSLHTLSLHTERDNNGVNSVSSSVSTTQTHSTHNNQHTQRVSEKERLVLYLCIC